MSASATRDDWLAAVAKALRLEPDAALDRLRSTTYDGITIEPLYTAADAPGPAAAAGGSRRGRWDVRQVVDAAAGPGRAVEELERGATSIVLDLTGVAEITADVVAAALDGVLLDVAPVVLHAGARWREAADAFAPARPVRTASAPTRSARRRAPVDLDLDEHLAASASASAATTASASITVDATRYHDAGCVRRPAARLRRSPSSSTTSAPSASSASTPTPCCGPLRAAPRRHRRPVRHDRLDPRPSPAVRPRRRGRGRVRRLPPIHAVTSRAMMTRYDPWVNALRSTVACFAAGVAGADAVTVLPHDGLRAADRARPPHRPQHAVDPHRRVAPRRGRRPGRRVLVRRAVHRPTRRGGVDWLQEIEQAGGFRRAVEDGLRRRAHRIDRRGSPARHRHPAGAADRPHRVPQRRRGDAAPQCRTADGDPSHPTAGRRDSRRCAAASTAVGGTRRRCSWRRSAHRPRSRREPRSPRTSSASPVCRARGVAVAGFGASGATDRLHLLDRRPLRRARRRGRRPARGGRGDGRCTSPASRRPASIARSTPAWTSAPRSPRCSTYWRSHDHVHCVPRPRRPLLVVRSLALAHSHRRHGDPVIPDFSTVPFRDGRLGTSRLRGRRAVVDA